MKKDDELPQHPRFPNPPIAGKNPFGFGGTGGDGWDKIEDDFELWKLTEMKTPCNPFSKHQWVETGIPGGKIWCKICDWDKEELERK